MKFEIIDVKGVDVWNDRAIVGLEARDQYGTTHFKIKVWEVSKWHEVEEVGYFTE